MKLKDACSLEGRGEAKTNLYHVLKSSDITLPTKVCIVKAATFPVVVYRCEIWTIKKAEGWKIDAFELWCWGTLESPLDSEEVKPVILQEINRIFIGRTDIETLILWPPDARIQLIGKDPNAGKD